MDTIVIAGLGNPGSKYQWTRHNAGFLFLDRIAQLEGLSIVRKQFGGLTAEWERKGKRLVLLKPQTFMNLSGRSVMPALQFYKLKPDQLIVVHDEIDLALGAARLKQGGGHGGQNGLRSIMELLGKGDFVRLRLGIGRPPHGDVTNHVLGVFTPPEMEIFARVLDGALDMLETALDEGVPKAMSLFNNKSYLEG
ncbi:aminoacyl-tRNA hydrolase [Trichlorobacter lovleyi]|jgi:peptidyl-tRNA hydrolase (EC 3.1.1.29)|uniref:Peptidyl-tRNA hydrolase n=1 Tax=Trichlorobacter lovleyi (strain ATCC BAA-1151 / DSM 17278 / SZ) TaxID=398767 RepID=PTH_TRIL1|nr:aminoacyl-tRNA hydrolase [Trichlorobacter lovleyi]B3E6F9.1 RecName: Full=Peptidyl-tRNA hydrolase; Short=PTH [Trichlorobacter lovleyi SZ]ACD96306.1 Aminoacyl-tRNA hydrolase [Trichlorobacter lovleyi SZ]